MSKKIEIETEIIAKQYKHLEKHQSKEKGNSLLNSKNDEGLHYVEMIMKKMTEEKKHIFRSLEEFNFNHFDVRKKLNNIKGTSFSSYITNITSQKLVNMIIFLSNEEGLDKLRKKILNTHNSTQKYQDFMNAVSKYGKTQR